MSGIILGFCVRCYGLALRLPCVYVEIRFDVLLSTRAALGHDRDRCLFRASSLDPTNALAAAVRRGAWTLDKVSATQDKEVVGIEKYFERRRLFY